MKFACSGAIMAFPARLPLRPASSIRRPAGARAPSGRVGFLKAQPGVRFFGWPLRAVSAASMRSCTASGVLRRRRRRARVTMWLRGMPLSRYDQFRSSGVTTRVPSGDTISSECRPSKVSPKRVPAFIQIAPPSCAGMPTVPSRLLYPSRWSLRSRPGRGTPPPTQPVTRPSGSPCSGPLRSGSGVRSVLANCPARRMTRSVRPSSATTRLLPPPRMRYGALMASASCAWSVTVHTSASPPTPSVVYRPIASRRTPAPVTLTLTGWVPALVTGTLTRSPRPVHARSSRRRPRRP